MLPVNIDEQRTDLPQHGSRGGAAIQPALPLSRKVDFPLHQKLPVLRLVAQRRYFFTQRGGDIGKKCRNGGPGLTGADDLLKGAAAQNGIDSADQDGLTGAGFAREHMKAL